jgi:hypothetical protein
MERESSGNTYKTYQILSDLFLSTFNVSKCFWTLWDRFLFACFWFIDLIITRQIFITVYLNKFTRISIVWLVDRYLARNATTLYWLDVGHSRFILSYKTDVSVPITAGNEDRRQRAFTSLRRHKYRSKHGYEYEQTHELASQYSFQYTVDPRTSNGLMFEQLETGTKNHVVAFSLCLVARAVAWSVLSWLVQWASRKFSLLFKRFIYLVYVYIIYIYIKAKPTGWLCTFLPLCVCC